MTFEQLDDMYRSFKKLRDNINAVMMNTSQELKINEKDEDVWKREYGNYTHGGLMCASKYIDEAIKAMEEELGHRLLLKHIEEGK